MLLKSYISLIGACGVTEVFDARDAFLGSLCRECVMILKDNQNKDKTPAAQTYRAKQQSIVFPAAGEKHTITPRNVLISKTLMNVSHSLCHVLDVKSWFIILETMQKIESVVNEKLQLNGFYKKGGQKDKPTFN